MTGTLYIISAPSGGGKTSLVNALIKHQTGIMVSISYTTRSQRPGEKADQDYHFVNHDQFETLIKEKEFLEYALVFGNYYGTSRRWVEDKLTSGIDVILEIDWQGAQQIRASMPHCISIFILPPSKEILYARLRDRARDELSTIETRMQQASSEISHCTEYDYLIINEHFAEALADLQSIFKAQRLRREAQKLRYEELIENLLEQPSLRTK